MILPRAYPDKNAERLNTHFDAFTNTRDVSFSQNAFRFNMYFMASIGWAEDWISVGSGEAASLPPATAHTLSKAMIIFAEFALNHLRQRYIVDSSAATVTSVPPCVSASSIGSVP
jgi:hypothetical protein